MEKIIVKPRGIGDLTERVFIKIGISAVVKKVAGEDCGCQQRKEKLNKLIPFKQ